MAFNIKQPHGMIYGHPVARFEQNGQYYDGSGKLVPPERMNEEEEKAQVEIQAQEEKKLKELAQAMPSAVKRRGRPPGAKNKSSISKGI